MRAAAGRTCGDAFGHGGDVHGFIADPQAVPEATPGDGGTVGRIRSQGRHPVSVKHRWRRCPPGESDVLDRALGDRDAPERPTSDGTSTFAQHIVRSQTAPASYRTPSFAHFLRASTSLYLFVAESTSTLFDPNIVLNGSSYGRNLFATMTRRPPGRRDSNAS